MEIRAYMLDMTALSGEEAPDTEPFRQLCAGLSESRQRKIEKFRYAQGKALSLGAGLLLDYGLRWYGLRERTAALIYGADEKPYLRDYPEIFFNLSHSGTWVMAVFADREVGCDVERISKPDFRVVQRFFAEGEKKILEKAEGEEEQRQLFYRFWTLKESFLKVTGKGIHMPLDGFCIHLGPPIKAEMGGGFPEYRFQEFSLPGYKAALCVEGSEKAEEQEETIKPEFLSLGELIQEILTEDKK